MRRKRILANCFGALVFAMLFGLAAEAAPGGATITYRRVFKGSTPELIEIKINDGGKATFEIRQLDDDPDPEPFEVGSTVQNKVFELAGDLKHFAIPSLDIQKKIANLGEKTFRYENGADVHETSFNYTLNPSAAQLMQIFEGLAKQQEDLVLLQRSAKYDRLGVNDALMQFEADMERKTLPEPERFLAILDQIAADSHFIDIARSRARALAQRIRSSQGQ